MSCCGNGNKRGSSSIDVKGVGLPLNHMVSDNSIPNEQYPGAVCDAVPIQPSCPTPNPSPQVVPTCNLPYINRCAPAPQPYYRQGVKMCPEDNKEIIREIRTSQTFKTAQSFSIPACGASIRVVFDYVGDVAIGANMWAQGIGLLVIKGFNAYTREIELEPICSDTATCVTLVPAGTVVPKCTVFVLAAPQCGASSSSPGGLTPFLNAGFTAPAVSACIVITVTNVNGLSVNKNISLNNGIYRISAISSATNITICNDGQGLTPGTVVDYKDSQGTLIVPIVLIDSNPCLITPVLSGVVLVCKDNIEKPLIGSENNQVLVFNSDTNESNFRTLGIPTLDCTELTVCLTLDPELPEGTAYLVTVISTTGFTVGQEVLIGGTVFIIDEVVSATQLRLIPQDDPTAIQTYEAGATLCSADCCTLLDTRVTSLEERMENVDDTLFQNMGVADPTESHLWAVVNADVSDAYTPATLTIGQSATGPEALLAVTNSSSDYSMGTVFTVEGVLTFNSVGSVDKASDILFELETSGGVGLVPPVSYSVLQSLPNTYRVATVPTLSGYNRHSLNFKATIIASVAALASHSLKARPKLTLFDTNLETGVSVLTMNTTITAIGVAVR
jgi:hypothetical protein